MRLFKLYDPRASAQFFSIIHSKAPSQIWVYVATSLILLLFQGSLIFNEEISETYTHYLLSKDPSYN